MNVAKYRKAIAAGVPSFVQLFQNHPSKITVLTVSALVKLAGHGMRPVKSRHSPANVCM
jgi:hypothetical protein